MALNTKSLTAPGDVKAVDRLSIAAGAGSGGGNMPTWGVGDPIATAVAGFQRGMEKFKRYYDDAKVNEFLTNKAMELDKMYYDKDNGLFNTRKGEAAQGMYQEGVQAMRDMWEKDAQENLSDTQRAMIGKGMQRLFADYGHRIAKYETDEMINGTKNRLENTLFNAKNMVASGDFTEDDLALSLTSVRSAVHALGALQGLDGETIQRQIDEQTGELITKSAMGLAATKPEMARGMLLSYKDMIPAMQYEPAMKTITKRAEAEAKRQASVRTQAEMSAMLQSLDEANAGDVLALAQEKYPNDPGKQAKLLSQWNGRQEALKRVQNQKDKLALTQFGETVKTQIMALPLEQRADAAENMIANMPTEEMQNKARKIYYNLEGALNPETGKSVTMDHPGFFRKASERIANGEAFDVAADYGDVLTPETIKKLSDKVHKDTIKRASKAFHAGSAEFMAGSADQKNFVKNKYGSTAKDVLWQRFCERLPEDISDADLEKRATNFWKKQVLDHPKLFGMFYSEVTVPLGDANQYIEEHEGENWQIGRHEDNDPYRQAATDAIKLKGQKYTDENYSRASREVINSRLTGEID